MSSVSRASDNWPEHIALWRASRLTRAEYCRQHDLKFHTFIYQLKRQHALIKPLTLIPVKVHAAPASGGLVLHGPKGWSLAMASGVSPVWLAQLLAGLA
ncbi:MAG: IS66 family insertion sequence element accessory protein TnpA [Burkholderiaceae bacterium]